MAPSLTLRYFASLCNEKPRHFPPCSLLTRKDTSLWSKALRGLSGASSLKDERVGHYLATWALSWPLARWQFNKTKCYRGARPSSYIFGYIKTRKFTDNIFKITCKNCVSFSLCLLPVQ